jgi:glycosyltransferase involved in cell wall biosynthesis
MSGSFGHEVCAVVPCYNEARTVAPLVRAVRQHLELCIVVDDCSTDATARQAAAAGARVLRHERIGGGRGAVVDTDAEAPALHVQHQVLAHHGQADQAEVASGGNGIHAGVSNAVGAAARAGRVASQMLGRIIAAGDIAAPAVYLLFCSGDDLLLAE